MNKMFRSIGGRIGLGFILITVVMVSVLLLTILISDNNKNLSNTLFNLRVPTARASLKAVAGINQATSALRGWMIEQDSIYLLERQQAWDNEILPAFHEMDLLSKNWTNPDNIKRLSRAKQLLLSFEQNQLQIEKLQLKDQDKAKELLTENVRNNAFALKEILTQMTNNQRELMEVDFIALNEEMSKLVLAEWMALLVGIVISMVFAYLITRSIAGPINGAVEIAREVSKGNLEVNVNVGGLLELDILGESLEEMRRSILTGKIEADQYNWLTKGHNELYEVMRSEKDLSALSNDIIEFVTKYCKSEIGAIYLVKEDSNKLYLSGSYAFHESTVNLEYEMGKGLIGQVAASKEICEFNNVKSEDIRKSSTIIDAPPKHVIIAPITYQGGTIAVIELGREVNFTDVEKQFLKAIAESIGITLNTTIARLKVQELLEETQRQSEELEQQREELQQTNQELEEQTLKLKEQQEELQASNEELEEQTQMVEQKNQDLETARTEIEL